jgi:CTP:molybdopterin cytidylyltransferase MocA
MPLKPRLAAIILAAGCSSRMKQFKPLLPLGDTTVIEHVLGTIRRVQVTDIVVVAGYRAQDLISLAERQRLCLIRNERYTEGMYSSVQAGVHALSSDVAAFFLLPVDVPLVKPHSIRLLGRDFIRYQADVTYPVFQQERGHPPMVSARLIPQILAQNRLDGLQGLLAELEESARDVAVMDEGVLMDMDTPEDYQQICERFENGGIPSRAECEAIFSQLQTPTAVIRHGKMVATLAGNIALALNRSGLSLNVRWVESAGLLHDMAKNKYNHARYGSKILKSMGYGRVAESISQHMDLEFSATSPINETAVLFLADKMIRQDQFVSIEERFAATRLKYPRNQAIEQRFSTAKTIAVAVEQRIGQPLANLVPTGV